MINVAFGERRGDGEGAGPSRGEIRSAELRLRCPSRNFRWIEATAAPGDLARIADDVAALARAVLDAHGFQHRGGALRVAASEGALYDGTEADPADNKGASTACCATRRTRLEKSSPTGARTAARVGPAARPRGRGACRASAAGAAAGRAGATPPTRAARTQAADVRREVRAGGRAAAPPPAVVEGRSQSSARRARALLLGMGADELLAGYARHRTAFKRGGLEELEREVGVGVSRIATRNLGRDDRVTAAWAREARYPFLDEDVVRCVRWSWVRRRGPGRSPPGRHGCKRALRALALGLGLPLTS